MDPRLHSCHLLCDLTPQDREAIFRLGQPRRFVADQTVIHQGETGRSVYIVLEGEVETRREGHTPRRLGVGALFGEMSMFNEGVRTRDIVALTDTDLLEISQDAVMHNALHDETGALRFLEVLGRTMVERLQEQDEVLHAQAKAQGGEDPELASFTLLKRQLLKEWSLRYHALGRPGKLAITATKPSATAADLSIAYSPGVAEPCLAIQDDPNASYDYTARGQLVGVITNGTAVLGLGDIGAAAAKPVMEGKAILFKRFADLDAFDVEVNEKDPQRFVSIVKALEPTFGGINLEDIRAPQCFEIEAACKEALDIPVFHDDQHGTAIIAGAGLLNALALINKPIEALKVVFSGAGAAGVATARHLISLGVRRHNVVITDSRGVLHVGRASDKPYIADLAADTDARTLADAMEGADLFVGVSVANLVTPAMLLSMADNPLVFALANPNPEIDVDLARATRDDVIMATGRSDYPNQINNVIAFPYIFRGALDTRAREINEAMKHAATRAIAALARQPIDDDAGFSSSLSFGRDYLIPKPFDARLLPEVASVVAEAAMASGVARVNVDIDAYRAQLAALTARR